jgi:Crp-like helix-turn-helix domain
MPSRSANKLLNSLTAREYLRIRPFLHLVYLAHNAPLHGCGRSRVYFPTVGGCSIRRTMADGRTIEIASVGKEGLVGFGVSRSDDGSPDVYRQVGDGSAQYIQRADLEREIARGPALRQLVSRYTRAFFESVVRLAGCNQRHTLQERCCRWLLTTADELGRAHIEVTLKDLASAIGARPQQVAAVLKILENLRVVHHDSQGISLLDRKTVEQLTCSCYENLKRSFSHDRTDVEQSGTERRLSDSAAPQLAKVIRVRPILICERCGVNAPVVHKTVRDCVRAVDTETKSLMECLTRLRKQREALMHAHLNSVAMFLNRTNPRFS